MYYIQFGPSRDYKPYTPGTDLREQIEAYKGRTAPECPMIECPYRCPDFKAFDKKQLDFYLYFRDRFLNGVAITTDRGYSWLLLVEMVNDRSDPERVMGLLRKYHDACSGHVDGFPATAQASNAMFYYALANDLDIPRVYVSEGVGRRLMISELLAPVPEPIPLEVVDIVTGYPFENYYNEDADGVDPYPLFEAALPAVDAKMRELTGKGIMETYGRGERTDVVNLFPKDDRVPIPYFHEDRCSVTYTWSDEALNTFMGAMLRYCAKVMEKDAGVGNGPSVASVFGKEYRKVVDRTFALGGDPEYPPKTSRGSVRRFDIGDVMVPMVMDSSDFGYHTVSRGFLDEMIDHADLDFREKREYVPSGYNEPDYRCLTKDALEYYYYWRHCAREGRYGPTDEGYLWLYECELINVYDDDEYVLEQLAGLAGAYDKFFDIEWYGGTKRPGRTYLDYAFLKCPTVPDPTVYPCCLSAADMIERLSEGDEDVPVSAALLLMLAGVDARRKSDKPIYAAFDEDCAQIAKRALLRIEKSRPKGVIRGYCGIRHKKAKMDLFENLKFYYWPDGRKKMQERPMLNVGGNETLMKETRALVKAVIAAVGNRGKAGKGKAAWAFGRAVSDFLPEEVENYYSEKKAEKAREEARNLVIDRSAVERAEQDLNHVTSIMSTEEVVEPERRVEPEKPKAVSGDPWQAFAGSLNKGQREYLRKALAGTLRAKKPVMEDSINVIAVDTVKDAVLEDGIVFEEYAEDARKALESVME